MFYSNSDGTLVAQLVDASPQNFVVDWYVKNGERFDTPVRETINHDTWYRFNTILSEHGIKQYVKDYKHQATHRVL